MTRYTNEDLIRRFVRGGEDGEANNMAISECDGWTLLWGYGHALYAARRKDDELLFVYNGWHGYSQTTSTHMGKLRATAKTAYGKPREDGYEVRAVVTGDGQGKVLQAPPGGHELIIVDDRVGTSYGKLDAEGRPELSDLDGRYVPTPSGYS